MAASGDVSHCQLRPLPVLWTFAVICVSSFAFNNELKQFPNKKYFGKERKTFSTPASKFSKALSTDLQKRVNIPSFINDETTKINYHRQSDDVTDKYINNFIVPKPNEPIKSPTKYFSRSGKSFSSNFSALSSQSSQKTIDSHAFNNDTAQLIVFTTTDTPTNKCEIDSLKFLRKHYFNSKLRSSFTSLKPSSYFFDLFKNTKSPIFSSTSNLNSILESSNKLNQLTDEHSRDIKFQTELYFDSKVKNNSVRGYNLVINNYTNGSSVSRISDLTTTETLYQIDSALIRKGTKKTFLYGSNKSSRKHVNPESSANYLNNSVSPSVNFLKKQWHNHTNFINKIKNIFQPNSSLSYSKTSEPTTIITSNNTYSTNNSIVSDHFPANTSTHGLTGNTTSLLKSFTKPYVSTNLFTSNFHVNNEGVVSNFTESTSKVNYTLVNFTVSDNGLNISDKGNLNQVFSENNSNKTDDESWFSSIFEPIKNTLWFLWPEPNKPNETVIPDFNNVSANLTMNQTDNKRPAVFVGSLNSTNVTVLFPTNENRSSASPVFYVGNITSLANITNNSSNPTIVIANNTLVSVIANGSHLHPELFKTKENRTWLSRVRATVVHWVGDVYDCLTNHTEPVSFKDIRFFLYTRNNSKTPEELFLKLQDITTPIEDDSDTPILVDETYSRLCKTTVTRSSHSHVGDNSSTSRTVAITTETNVCITAEATKLNNSYRKRSARGKQNIIQAAVQNKPRKKHKQKVQSNRKPRMKEKKKCIRGVCLKKNDFVALNSAKSIYSKYFNVIQPTKIIIHGYTQSYLEDSMIQIKEAYLTKGPYNIIMVDWSALSHSPCYPMVSKQSKSMGIIVSHLIEQLSLGGTDMSTVHIIGFSIGAQIAGFAGAALETGDVYRVTGLDPASPFFDVEPGSSLDASDATFVDIIHTSAGFLGQPGPLGHADFYPNGGSQQPGCDFTALACSHDRAAWYYAESISSDTGFPAFKCSSWDDFQNKKCNITGTKVLMGDPCISKAKGIFYLATGDSEPFSNLRRNNKTKKSFLADLFK